MSSEFLIPVEVKWSFIYLIRLIPAAFLQKQTSSSFGPSSLLLYAAFHEVQIFISSSFGLFFTTFPNWPPFCPSALDRRVCSLRSTDCPSLLFVLDCELWTLLPWNFNNIYIHINIYIYIYTHIHTHAHKYKYIKATVFILLVLWW